ncbi:LysR family transcriptional regulator [Mesorhizobium sp.]|uniref:helix-turn-helix domain-containing protein n=1 Tax=Mesorhizobium sp. TaxID=1871066 RepID=UPI000FE7805A|nr:MAG: LysR family transcriptional regulator [Mesorhizobium sp.]TIV56103.1 MAG: LysR family transcriptional regulator [Mesorhizobium sp.]
MTFRNRRFSHHLQRLEDALQLQLFVRKRSGLELTDAGESTSTIARPSSTVARTRPARRSAHIHRSAGVSVL